MLSHHFISSMAKKCAIDITNCTKTFVILKEHCITFESEENVIIVQFMYIVLNMDVVIEKIDKRI